MKKRVIGVVAALMLTMAASGAVHAMEGVEVSVGGKMWVHAVKVESAGFNKTSDMAVMIGPAVEAKFSNNVFVNGSIATTATKYAFSDPDAEFSRTDIDLAVGYSFVPTAGVYAGYRNSAFSGDMKSTTSGPLVGVSGSIPINEEFSMYGDLAYFFFEDKPDQGTSEDAPGVGIEIGVKYAFAKNLDGGVGYKMEQTKGDDSKVKNTFSGVTLKVMYQF